LRREGTRGPTGHFWCVKWVLRAPTRHVAACTSVPEAKPKPSRCVLASEDRGLTLRFSLRSHQPGCWHRHPAASPAAGHGSAPRREGTAGPEQTALPAVGRNLRNHPLLATGAAKPGLTASAAKDRRRSQHPPRSLCPNLLGLRRNPVRLRLWAGLPAQMPCCVVVLTCAAARSKPLLKPQAEMQSCPESL